MLEARVSLKVQARTLRVSNQKAATLQQANDAATESVQEPDDVVPLRPPCDEEMMAVNKAQEQLEEHLGGDLSVEEMLSMMSDPRNAGPLLIRSLVNDDQARRALILRSFFLGDLYGSELEETRALLETTRINIKQATP